MDELEPLSTALRTELGSPSKAWHDAQRARVQAGLRAPAPRSLSRATPWALAALALLAVLVGVVVSRSGETLDQTLVAEALAAPFELGDGSSIALDPGARGHLVVREDSVRFALERGRARFDVNPERRRTWSVTAGKNEVQVLGTRFSVVYGLGEEFDVEVERGTVSVRVPDQPARIELKAGEHFRERSPRGRSATAAPSANTASAPNGTAEPASEAKSAGDAPLLPSSDWQARYRAGKYAEALALARASGVVHRLAELSPAALSDLAEAARLAGDSDLAVRALMSLLKRFPATAEGREARFLLGRVQALRGQAAAAIESFEGYLAGGATRYESEALGRLMELYAARGDDARARESARRYLERAPKGPYQRLAQSLVSR
jgi:TolA-binding protein